MIGQSGGPSDGCGLQLDGCASLDVLEARPCAPTEVEGGSGPAHLHGGVRQACRRRGASFRMVAARESCAVIEITIANHRSSRVRAVDRRGVGVPPLAPPRNEIADELRDGRVAPHASDFLGEGDEADAVRAKEFFN